MTAVSAMRGPLFGLTRLARQIAGWGAAHAIIRTEEYLFDFLLYPFMLYAGGPALVAGATGRSSAILGYWVGFAVMVFLSIVVNLSYLAAYDRLGRDLFGLEAARAYERRFAERRFYRPIRPVVKFIAFGYLAVWHNPLFATLFLRQDARPFQMDRGDWRVFGLALVIANFGWAGLVSGAVGLWRVIVSLALT